jgi:hypothetical protein
MKKVIYIIILMNIIGCACISQGTTDNVRVITFDDISQNTKCTLRNEEGIWNNIAPQTLVSVHRDGNDLLAECTNDTQFGEGSEESIMRSGVYFMTMDLFLGGIIALTIDGINNAWYDYDEKVLVKMKSKITK